MDLATKNKIKIGILVLVFALILLFLMSSSVGAGVLDNIIKERVNNSETFLRYDSESSALYDLGNGTLKKVFYPTPRFVPVNDSFIKFEDYLNISQVDNKGKTALKLENLDGEICYINLDYELSNKSKAKADLERFNIEKRETNYYFTSELSDDVTNVSYQVECENSYFENEKLVLMDEIRVDFKQARTEQNISTRYDNLTKELIFEPLDRNLSRLKLIDPTVEYNYSTETNIWARDGERCDHTTFNASNKLNPESVCDFINDLTSDTDLDASDDSRQGTFVASATNDDSGLFFISWINVGNLEEGATITNITFLYEGNANPDNLLPSFFVWNVTGNRYDLYNLTPLTASDTEVIFDSIELGYSISELVDPQNNVTFAIVDNESGSTGTAMFTDYIEFQVTYESGDATPPVFTTIPNNITLNYSQGFGVDFDATDNVLVDKYFINWTQFFSINQSGFLQNSSPNLNISYYEINVSVNDTNNNINYTIFTVNVSRGDPINNMLLSGTSPITYGTNGDFEGTESNTGDADLTYNLYRDGQVVSNPDTSILPVGLYEYEYNTTGGENWTSGRTLQNLTINQATPTGDLINQTQITLTYGSPFNFTFSESNSGDDDVAYQVFRDGINITNEAGLNRVLAGGTYNYTLNSTGGENYSSTASLDSFIVTINKANSEVATYLNGTRGNKVIETGLNITVNSSLLTGVFGTLNLTINGVEVNSSTSNDLTYWSTYSAGTYLVNTSYLGNENYTVDSEAFTLTVLAPPYFESLNEFPEDPATYSPSQIYNFNVSTITNQSIDTVLLEFNGVNYTTNQSTNECYQEFANRSTSCGGLNSGLYSIEGVIGDLDNEAEAYDGDYDTSIVPQLVNSFNFSTNYTRPNNITKLSKWQVAFASSADGIKVFKNFTLGDSCLNRENIELKVYADFTASPSKIRFECWNGTNWDVLFNNSVGGFNAFQFYEGAMIWDYHDTHSTNLQGLSAGDYNYTWYANDSNGLSNTTNGNYSIAKASNGNISGLGTFEYPYESTVTGNEFNDGDADVTYTLFRDLVAVSNPDVNNFSVGEYVYKFNSTEGENYSASELDTGILNITKNNSYILNITGTGTITYGTAGDFEGVGCPAQISCSLFRNSTYDSWVSTSNPDTSILSAVLHNYVYNSSGNENYSNKQFFKNLTINQATPTGDLINQTALKFAYGNTFNFTTSESNTGDADVVYQVFRDGINITNEEALNIILAGGEKNYTLNSTEGINYSSTASLDSFIVNITKANGDGTLYIDHLPLNASIFVTATAELNATLDNGNGDISIYYDGGIWNTGTSPLYNESQFNTVGSFLVNLTYNGNENYSEFEKLLTLTVLAGSSSNGSSGGTSEVFRDLDEEPTQIIVSPDKQLELFKKVTIWAIAIILIILIAIVGDILRRTRYITFVGETLIVGLGSLMVILISWVIQDVILKESLEVMALIITGGVGFLAILILGLVLDMVRKSK